ncbi:MAG: hypothetical protein ABI925_08225 [Verrucomicrobiota bacterium]
MKSDDQKGLSVILIYLGLLFFLIGMAGRVKMDFHHAKEIFTLGMSAAAISASLGVIVFLFSLRKRQD